MVSHLLLLLALEGHKLQLLGPQLFLFNSAWLLVEEHIVDSSGLLRLLILIILEMILSDYTSTVHLETIFHLLTHHGGVDTTSSKHVIVYDRLRLSVYLG